jgi:hypothetical protein
MGRVPVGVAVLAILLFIGGALSIFQGLTLVGAVAFGPAQTGSGVALAGGYAVLYGVLLIVFAVAAWRRASWAWYAGMVLAAIGLCGSALIAIANASIAHGCASAILPAVVIWYLNTPPIRGAFDVGE